MTVTDDDEVGLTLSTTALGVAEGDDGEYTVRLSTQPTATVTVAVTGQAGTDLTLDSTSLTLHDGDVEHGADGDGPLRARTTTGRTTRRRCCTRPRVATTAGETASVAVTVTDDDEVELTLSTTALGVAEGDDGEYTVRLSTQPTAQVTVAVTGHSGTDLTLDTAALTFTDGDVEHGADRGGPLRARTTTGRTTRRRWFTRPRGATTQARRRTWR